MDCGFRIADFSLRRTFLVDHGPWSTGRVCERPAIANPHSIGVLCQIGSQKPSRIGVAALHEFFWEALEEDLPACISALWSEVDDPVRGLQHVQIVLYHNQGIP